MSNKKIVLLFSLVFFLASVQALKAQDYPVIYEGPDMIRDMIYVEDDTFIGIMYIYSEGLTGFVKMNEEGVALGLVFFADDEHNNILNMSELMSLPDEGVGVLFTTMEDGIARLNLAKVNQDLELTTVVFEWEGNDYPDNPLEAFPNYIVDNDGQIVFSYCPAQTVSREGRPPLRLLKFDQNGNLFGERLMEDIIIHSNYWNYMVNASDGSGYRLVLCDPDEVKYDCHYLDKGLNTVMVKRFIDEPIYPLLCGNGKLYLNPYNGKTYSTVTYGVPAYNQNPAIEMDILHGVYDEDFNIQNHAWSIHTPIVSSFHSDQPAFYRAIDFSPDGKVYALAMMDFTFLGLNPQRDWNFYLAMFDENLNKEWEVLYHNNDYAGAGLSVCASPKGGCLVAIQGFDRNDPVLETQYRLLRITESIIDGVGEAEASTAAKAWPNPTTGTVRIEAEDVKEIQVFNQLGQCLKTAQDTNEVSLEGLPQGLYLLRVTLEDGNVFSDKVVKE